MSSKKAKEDKSLKTIRDYMSLSYNKQCFECGSRGPTYVDMTVGSYVCTTCSGLLRGLNPPHRVKSVNMSTFAQNEVDFLRDRGNEFNRQVWLGLFDPRSFTQPEPKEVEKFKTFLSQKYEQKRWCVEATSEMKDLAKRNNDAAAAGSVSESSQSKSRSGSLIVNHDVPHTKPLTSLFPNQQAPVLKVEESKGSKTNPGAIRSPESAAFSGDLIPLGDPFSPANASKSSFSDDFAPFQQTSSQHSSTTPTLFDIAPPPPSQHHHLHHHPSHPQQQQQQSQHSLSGTNGVLKSSPSTVAASKPAPLPTSLSVSMGWPTGSERGRLGRECGGDEASPVELTRAKSFLTQWLRAGVRLVVLDAARERDGSNPVMPPIQPGNTGFERHPLTCARPRTGRCPASLECHGPLAVHVRSATGQFCWPCRRVYGGSLQVDYSALAELDAVRKQPDPAPAPAPAPAASGARSEWASGFDWSGGSGHAGAAFPSAAAAAPNNKGWPQSGGNLNPSTGFFPQQFAAAPANPFASTFSPPGGAPGAGPVPFGGAGFGAMTQQQQQQQHHHQQQQQQHMFGSPAFPPAARQPGPFNAGYPGGAPTPFMQSGFAPQQAQAHPGFGAFPNQFSNGFQAKPDPSFGFIPAGASAMPQQGQPVNAFNPFMNLTQQQNSLAPKQMNPTNPFL